MGEKGAGGRGGGSEWGPLSVPLYLIPSALLFLSPTTACSRLHHAVGLGLAHTLPPAGGAAPHPPAGACSGAVPCRHCAAGDQGLQVG